MTRTIVALALAVVLPSFSPLVISSLAPAVLGAEGRPRVVRLPQSAHQIDGFTCDVQLINPEGFGYLPLRLEAASAGGRFPADRTIVVRLVPLDGLNLPHPQTDYELELKLREGESSATAVHYLPKYFIGSTFRIVLAEAGERLDGYELEWATASGSVDAVQESRFAVILPDPQRHSGEDWERVPDLRSINTVAMPDVAYLTSTDQWRLDDDEALQNLVANSSQTRQILRESQTHRQWLGYESVDVVLVAFGVLERMRETEPQRFAALRQWVACGGALWSYGVGDPAALADLFDATAPAANDVRIQQEMQAAIASFDPAQAIPRVDRSFAAIRKPGVTAEELQFLTNDLSTWWARTTSSSLTRRVHPAAETVSASEISQRVFPQPLAAGMIVGIKDPDPFPGSLQFWHAVRHLTGPRQLGQLRYGRPVVGGTPGYWEWVLENVARPPVYTFLGLMSGFVLLVGPVAYFLTRRRGRTYLMFLIAPVLATIATLLLFGYGLVADGLGTQVRIRQITWVDGAGADGAGGSAARMTRSTYFAGFRPAEGLKFPLDTAVYPIVDDEEGLERLEDGPLKLDRRITVNDQYQQFTGGFLPSRRQRQFVATRPIEDAGGIAWTKGAGGPATARNEFPFRVLRLLVRDAGGDYYSTEDEVAVGGEVEVRPMPERAVGSTLRDVYLVEPLEPPMGYDPNSSGRRGRTRYHARLQLADAEMPLTDHSWFRPGSERGLFESRLRTMLQDQRAIPPGWFVGHAEVTEEASAVDGARPVASVHYIMGTLR